MFTGLVSPPPPWFPPYLFPNIPQIEPLGAVSAISLTDEGCTLTIADSAPILSDCHIGDSIAVNGACLTVTEFDPAKQGGFFKVWLANETLQRTDLGLSQNRCFFSGYG